MNEALCATKYAVYSIVPIEEMTKQKPLPGLLLRVIALCEVLDALGLILSGLLRIRPGLTPGCWSS